MDQVIHTCILHTLVTIQVHTHCVVSTLKVTHLLGETKDGVVGTSLVEHISQEVLLTVVRGEDGNALRRVALETHVHKQSNSILCLGQVLGGDKAVSTHTHHLVLKRH